MAQHLGVLIAVNEMLLLLGTNFILILQSQCFTKFIKATDLAF